MAFEKRDFTTRTKGFLFIGTVRDAFQSQSWMRPQAECVPVFGKKRQIVMKSHLFHTALHRSIAGTRGANLAGRRAIEVGHDPSLHARCLERCREPEKSGMRRGDMRTTSMPHISAGRFSCRWNAGEQAEQCGEVPLPDLPWITKGCGASPEVAPVRSRSGHSACRGNERGCGKPGAALAIWG